MLQSLITLIIEALTLAIVIALLAIRISKWLIATIWAALRTWHAQRPP